MPRRPQEVDPPPRQGHQGAPAPPAHRLRRPARLTPPPGRDLLRRARQHHIHAARYIAGMPHKTAVILRAADIDRTEIEYDQRLNPRSKFRDAGLAHVAGLDRIGLSRGRLPPGGESFAYHAHHAEQEWVFIVSGRARARIDDREVELGPGDFAAFPAPQV